MLQGRAYAQACIRKMRHAMRWPVSDESFSGCPTKMDSHPCSIEKEIPRHACRANDGQLVSAIAVSLQRNLQMQLVVQIRNDS